MVERRCETASHLPQRPVTTVPSQALFLINHPLVHRQSMKLARAVISQHDDDRDRLHRLWLRLHGRPPRDEEIELSLRFVRQVTSHLPEDENTTANAWASLCRTLIAGSSFQYVD